MRVLMVRADILWNALLKLRKFSSNRSDLSAQIAFQDERLVLVNSDGDHFVNQEHEDLSLYMPVQTHFHSLFELYLS